MKSLILTLSVFPKHNILEKYFDKSCIDNDKNYLLICENIFNKSKYFLYDSGEALQKWAKEIRLWGV